MKIKEFVKEHKETVTAITAGIILCTGLVIISKNVKNTRFYTSIIPNVEKDTVDLVISNGKKSDILWSWDYGEAPIIACELEDAIAVIRPEG